MPILMWHVWEIYHILLVGRVSSSKESRSASSSSSWDKVAKCRFVTERILWPSMYSCNTGLFRSTSAPFVMLTSSGGRQMNTSSQYLILIQIASIPHFKKLTLSLLADNIPRFKGVGFTGHRGENNTALLIHDPTAAVAISWWITLMSKNKAFFISTDLYKNKTGWLFVFEQIFLWEHIHSLPGHFQLYCFHLIFCLWRQSLSKFHLMHWKNAFHTLYQVRKCQKCLDFIANHFFVKRWQINFIWNL